MIFGWKVIFNDENIKQLFVHSSKKVCISAHSTPFIDGLLIHYALDYINIPHFIYSKYLFMFAPLWCKEITLSGGFVKKEVKRLNQLHDFCCVIFPSGGKIKWKSGFYFLAKETNADIFVIGIDYKLKNIVIDSKLDMDTLENVKNNAKKRLCKYSPGLLWLFLRNFIGYGCETYDSIYYKDL